MKTHYSIAKTLNECLAKLTKDPNNLPAEAVHNRKIQRRKSSLNLTPSAMASPNAAFTFSGVGGYKRIEKYGEIDTGDNLAESKLYAIPSLKKRK